MRNSFVCVLFWIPAASVAEDSPKETASQWLAGLGDEGLVVREVAKATKPDTKVIGFTAKQGPSALGPITKFSYQKTGWWVTVVFKGKHTRNTPLKTLRKNFWFATIDKMPTPGLKIEGWEIRPRTPSSQVKQGVEILEYADGKLKVRIKTKAFALYGRDTTVLVPADAPTPPDAYFQIRQQIPIQLTIQLTITGPVEF